ncbi:hypothetical protein OH809_18075 [Streptomyces sp. NBC_00873]|uniref:hypothetical protein n=1 Tax=unclassified Streptomyces TaxID=2593676 RepID=UPI00386A159D|nr:hypothetical protein OH809_18075 [Streptomyces sp. NBC_00873]WTA45577.1 hypothetical protein OH821_25610 [Streptomyces sp. NBC_00842]
MAFLAGTALAGGAAAVQYVATPDTGVTVRSEPKKSRADYIRLWEADPRRVPFAHDCAVWEPTRAADNFTC